MAKVAGSAKKRKKKYKIMEYVLFCPMHVFAPYGLQGGNAA